MLGGHILRISKTIFTKLIFPLRLSGQLHDVVFQEFDIHSMSVIYLSIKNNFTVLISKAIAISPRTHMCWQIYFYKNWILEKEVNFPYY